MFTQIQKSLAFTMLSLAAACLVASFATNASAQGMLIGAKADVAFIMPRARIAPFPRPRPEVDNQAYKIKELAINASLSDQIAKVQVTQSFVNTGNRQMEVSFVYPLPYDGAIDQLTFMVDGKEYEGKLLSATEARTIYEGYMRRNEDPALMEWMGRGMFKTSVFPVPPGAERTVTMKYTQVAKKAGGVTEFMFPLSTAKYTSKPIEKVSINVNVQSSVKLKNIYSPTHAVDIDRPSNIQAAIKFDGQNQIPSSDFRLLFDVGDGPVGASVLSYRPDSNESGYFMMMVSPEIRKESEAQRKTVVLVVDRSGSMSGKKMEQAKNALKFVLNNLNEGDLFNVIAYDSVVESYQPELQRYNDDNRKKALGWVEGLYAGGSTNIDGALKSAFGLLQDEKQPNYIVFMTDGLPTAGETKEPAIITNAVENNKVRARVFSFGVGYDLNSRLLDKLSRKCFGQSDYVRPNEDIETHISKLYNRIGAPALSNLQIAYDQEGFKVEDGSPVSRVYPRDAYDLFAGDQLVLVGRYKKAGAAKVNISGTVDGDDQKFDFPAELIEKSNDETYAFIEKIWATRRVGEIIDDIDLNGKNPELIDELVDLSTKHGILTPYTSFLADDQPTVENRREMLDLAADNFGALEEADGIAGFAQRAEKAEMKLAAQAPAAGAARFRDAKSDKEVVVNSIQNVGNKTFFLRNGRWTDSAATADQLTKPTEIKRFSKEYFDLVSEHGKDAAQYLAIEGDVLLVLGGKAYSF